VPWYITWLLPLAGLASSVRLRRWTLALGSFLVLTFMPATQIALSRLRVDPMSGPAGQVSFLRQQSLEH
jgi:hypothetical protein